MKAFSEGNLILFNFKTLEVYMKNEKTNKNTKAVNPIKVQIAEPVTRILTTVKALGGQAEFPEQYPQVVRLKLDTVRGRLAEIRRINDPDLFSTYLYTSPKEVGLSSKDWQKKAGCWLFVGSRTSVIPTLKIAFKSMATA